MSNYASTVDFTTGSPTTPKSSARAKSSLRRLKRRSRPRRLFFEPLEDRRVLSNMLYLGMYDNGSQFNTYNLHTDTLSLVKSGFPQYSDLDASPAGVLYGTSGSTLSTIDTSTGTATSVATLNLGGTPIVSSGFTFKPDGSIFVHEWSNRTGTWKRHLFSGSATTGNLTLVGEITGLSGSMYGIEYANGTLYGSYNNALYSINTNTGVATLIGSGTRAWDMDYGADGVMRGVDPGTKNLYEINLTTSNMTLISTLLKEPWGIASSIGGASATVIYAANMDANPGWTFDTGSQWAWGTPTGSGGDPTSGYTGSNVVGYNLNGPYPNSMASTYYARTPAINCAGYTGVTLSFWRWLGVESSLYDHANLQVSNNGTTWTPVWENSTTTLNETAWSRQTYDISAVADNQATVYVRWGMGTTDSIINYSGWNIDDVTVTGVDSTPPTVTGRSPAPSSTITNSSVNIDVTFSEPVQGVDATDLVLTGTAAGAAVKGTPTNTSGNTWRFPVSNLASGALNVSLAPDPADIQDLAGNTLANVTWSYTVSLTSSSTEGLKQATSVLFPGRIPATRIGRSPRPTNARGRTAPGPALFGHAIQHAASHDDDPGGKHQFLAPCVLGVHLRLVEFYIDGVEQGSWSGEQAWAQQSYPVTAGSHTFRWTYSKDVNQVGGSDAAWIDDIVFPLGGTSDTTPPTTGTVTAPNVVQANAGQTNYQFTIQYLDNVAINVASLDGNDVTVTGPGFTQNATFVSATPTGNGTPSTATYRITPPGGSWNDADNGTYTIRLNSNQVFDTAGNAAAGNSSLATFTANMDTTIPSTGTVTAPTVVQANAGQTSYQFTIQYLDNVAINVASLDGNDVTVTGPGFTQNATFVSATPTGNGTPRTATYRITPPGGSWNDADNGTYTIVLNPNQVFDTAGNAAASNSSLATFTVDIVELSPPVLVALPEATPGTSRTVTWAAVADADEYYVEVDTSSDFNAPAGSGWIAGTGHTFQGLVSGETYYYRVMARQSTSGGTSTWSQTTQAEFNTGTLTATVATPDGQVQLAGGAGGGSQNIFVYSYDASQAFIDDIAARGHTVTKSAAWPANPSLYDVIIVTGGINQPATIANASIDGFTSAGGGLIVFDDAIMDGTLLTSASSNPVASFNADWVLRTGTTVVNAASPLTTGLGTTSTLSGYTITPTLKTGSDVAIRWSAGTAYPMAVTYANGAGRIVFFNDFWAYYNNNCWYGHLAYGSTLMSNAIDYVATSAGYAPSGMIVSPTMEPADLDSWGALTFNKNTPASTTLTIDVLSGAGSVLATNVTSGTSLAGLGITASSLKLRGNLTTSNTSVTPALHDWTVTWQEPTSYVESDWSNTVYSTQDAAPPTTGDVSAPDVDQAGTGQTSYQFTIQYLDNVAIDVGSLDGNDVTVTGPGFSQNATFVSVVPSGNGTPRTATYQMTPPGGDWDEADNGIYTIGLNANQVFDTAGNAAAANASLATFTVDIAPSGTLSAVLDAGTLTIADSDSVGVPNALTVSRVGEDLVITEGYEQFSAAPAGGTLSGNNRTLTIPLASITGSLVINLGGGDDVLTVDFAGGNPIPAGGLTFDGGAGDDLLRVLGSGTQNVTYTPSSTTFGDGAVAVDGRTIAFAGLEPTDYDNVGTFTLSLPNAADVVQIAAGTLAGDPASDALVFTGTSGGVAIESAHVRNTTNVVLDTTASDGDDTITVTGADNDHGNTNLTILTGTGADTVTITGDVALATGGALRIETRTITVAAGAGIAVTGDVTLAADSLDLASTASIDAGNNAVILRPLTAGTRIDLGGADVLSGSPRTLGLTDAELDRITAGTLTIGNAGSGEMKITAPISRSAATDVNLISGGAIVFDPGSIDTAGGDLSLAPGTGAAADGRDGCDRRHGLVRRRSPTGDPDRRHDGGHRVFATERGGRGGLDGRGVGAERFPHAGHWRAVYDRQQPGHGSGHRHVCRPARRGGDLQLPRQRADCRHYVPGRRRQRRGADGRLFGGGPTGGTAGGQRFGYGAH
jgi:hypothetical protein